MKNDKYLRELSSGVEVKIKKGNVLYWEVVGYRTAGGANEAKELARKIRDREHMRLFGHAISDRSTQTTNRSPRNKGLPAGVSWGYSRGKLLYVVVSNNTTKNKPSRIRLNIKKLGTEEALLEALELRLG